MLPTTRAEPRTRASLALAPANDNSTAVRHTRPARRQHCRGHLRLFLKTLVHLLPACPITQHKLPLFCAHGLLRRLSHILTVQNRRREPVPPARIPSTRVQFRRREHAPRAPFPSAMVRVRRREPTLTAPFPSASGNPRSKRRSPQPRHKFDDGGTRFKRPPPSTMAREPALDAPLPPATRRAAMGLLRRRVALLSERVHPLLFRTRRWRSV